MTMRRFLEDIRDFAALSFFLSACVVWLIVLP